MPNRLPRQGLATGMGLTWAGLILFGVLIARFVSPNADVQVGLIIVASSLAVVGILLPAIRIILASFKGSNEETGRQERK